jgi:hypothetical protein
MDKARMRELIERVRVVGDPSDKGVLCDELMAELEGKVEKPKAKKKGKRS